MEPHDADEDLRLMAQCLDLASRAESEGEVPVGALVTLEGRVVGRGWNQVIGRSDPTAHAEIMALREAAETVGNYRIPDSTLYVSLEPCCMCAGAMVHARVSCCVYAASDPKTGADGGAFDLLRSDRHNHRIDVRSGVMAEEAGQRLRDFFRRRR